MSESPLPEEVLYSSYLCVSKYARTADTYLTPDAARYLVESGIKTLGFDYLSVERLDNPVPEVHYLLLSNNIIIIEDLDLTRVDPGDYQIVALPLKIKDGNGSPTRVILIEEK